MNNTRTINHIEHHKTQPSRTLMRSAVKPMKASGSTRLKAHSAFRYHEASSLGPIKRENMNIDRFNRAIKVERSEFVSHFTRPLGSSFTPTHAHPIKAIVHKPKVEADLSIDELLLKAVDNIEDQLLNLEQQPLRRIHRFTRGLVANRFNGVALE
jgi:hypothetical protein